jgi:signal peptidase I
MTGHAILLLLGLTFTGLVAVDAARRRRNWLAWALVPSMFGGFGFLLWLLVRRRWPAGERLGAWRNALLFSSAVPLLAVAFMVVTFVNTFVAQVARVEGGAMMPTLANQDRLIVNKAAYQTGDPQLGDIVMLHYPLNPEKAFVMRVIAEEGDQVRLVRGRVYRNDVLKDEPTCRTHIAVRTTSGPWWCRRATTSFLATIGRTVPTVATGYGCRRSTSWGECGFAGGRSPTRECSEQLWQRPVFQSSRPLTTAATC